MVIGYSPYYMVGGMSPTGLGIDLAAVGNFLPHCSQWESVRVMRIAIDKGGGDPMSRIGMTMTMLGILLLWGSHPASAYAWKYQTPEGREDIWTSQSSASDNCQECEVQDNATAIPPDTSVSPLPVSVQLIVPVPVPAPYLGPYFYPGAYAYPPYYYAPGYYGPGAVIIRPPIGYAYGHFHGGRWHGGHFRR